MDDTFLEERKTGLGGSDMPVLLGVSPFGKTPTDIWREKLGYASPGADTAPMQRGRRLEPVAAEEYAKTTGRNIVTGVTLYRHPERPYLIGHVDGLIEDEAGWSGVLEIKVPNIQTYLRYKREGLADYVVIQQQAYLAVTGKQWSSAWIWNPELWQGIEVKVQRDEQIINLIYSKAEEFWHYVETNTPPPENGEKTSLPEMPKHTGEIVSMEDVDVWARAARDLRMASELKDEAERIYEEAKARIVGLMGPVEAAEGAGVRVYFKEQAGRKSFDKEALISDYIQAREALKVLIGVIPFETLLEHNESLRSILVAANAILAKPGKESSYQKQGKPFKSFRPYFLNTNQIEA